VGVLTAALGLACVPDFEVDLALVDTPRVLALRSEPAEAGPGQTLTLSALVAGPEGAIDTELDWSLCLARRPLAELGPIAPECIALVDDPKLLLELGRAQTIAATVPSDACRRFGPEPPPATPEEPTGRPVDPDLSGGYYQPILAALDGSPNLLQVRLRCGLAGATQAQAAEYTTRHQANLAPAVVRATARIDGETVDLLDADSAVRVARGQTTELRVSWADCPVDPVCGDGRCSLDEQRTCATDCDELPGCPGAETHVYFDPVELRVNVRREAIGVAWYATAGRFEHARTGRGSDDLATFSTNTWRADEPGLVHLWVIVRDDRAGVGWASFTLEVE
jgi:hypothetical protein